MLLVLLIPPSYLLALIKQHCLISSVNISHCSDLFTASEGKHNVFMERFLISNVM